jgi:hypothetical protein
MLKPPCTSRLSRETRIGGEETSQPRASLSLSSSTPARLDWTTFGSSSGSPHHLTPARPRLQRPYHLHVTSSRPSRTTIQHEVQRDRRSGRVPIRSFCGCLDQGGYVRPNCGPLVDALLKAPCGHADPDRRIELSCGLADMLRQTMRSSASATRSPKPRAAMSPSTISSASSPAHRRTS